MAGAGWEGVLTRRGSRGGRDLGRRRTSPPDTSPRPTFPPTSPSRRPSIFDGLPFGGDEGDDRVRDNDYENHDHDHHGDDDEHRRMQFSAKAGARIAGKSAEQVEGVRDSVHMQRCNGCLLAVLFGG